ncbi:MAG: magnesium transporter, partial [Clostridia bacterium]|nr:magnesium transporter [Clostridia bacterium]
MEREELEAMIELIKSLLEQKDFRQIKALLNNLKPQDTALLLQELSDKEMPPVFRLLNKELGAETFVEMDVDNQEMLINVFSDAELKAVFDEMFLDDTVDIIEEMPANVVKRIIKQTDAETRQMINQVLQYPKDSAGSIMTVEYVSLRKHWTVKECFDRIRRIAVDKETIYNCYVTDEKRVLLGIVTVKQLLLNSYTTTVEEIMETEV